MSKTRIGALIAATLASFAMAGGLYAQDARPAPSQDKSVGATGHTNTDRRADASTGNKVKGGPNESTRPNDQVTGQSSGNAGNESRSGANQSTRPNDQSNGTTNGQKRAQKDKKSKSQHPGSKESTTRSDEEMSASRPSPSQQDTQS